MDKNNLKTILLVYCVIYANATVNYTDNVYSKCPLADTNADIIIAGIFPVHVEVGAENCLKTDSCGYSHEHLLDGAKKCIRINKSAITWVEAMIETIRKINKNPSILRGVKLGYIICDGYNNINRALNISLMLQSLRHTSTTFSNMTSNSCSCHENDTRTVIGVIGGASSKISMSINYIMNVYDIPQISYSSTSPSLSDKFNFPTFFRTIPPDTYQGKALADVIQHFNWSYVSTVATSDDYGRLGIESFKDAVAKLDMCLAVEELFDVTLSLQSTNDQIKRIVSNLKSETRAKVVVLFCEWPSAQAILQEAVKQNLTGKTWIASEAWGDNNFVLKIRQDVIGGMLGLIPLGGDIEPFKNHVRNINPMTYSQNIWFKEYFKSTLKCMNISGESNRTSSITLDYHFGKSGNVMDAVNALAHALHTELGCDFKLSRCSWLDKRKEIDLHSLLHRLKNLTFTGALGVPMTFDVNGDPTGSYLITNLQQSETEQSSMQFVRIGRWDGRERKLLLKNGSKIYWNGWTTNSIESACSKPCRPGYFGIAGKNKCCWECFKCQDGHIKSTYGQHKCVKCKNGYISNENQTICIRLLDKHLDWSNPEAIVLNVTSFIGTIIISLSLVMYVKLRETPLVKASSCELSILLLVTLFAIFLTPLSFIGPPTSVTCILRPMGTGLLMTVATSILSVRAYRYTCIFRSKFQKKITKLQSLPSQFLSVFSCSLPPIGAMAIYFTLYPPQSTKRLVFKLNSLPIMYRECSLNTQYFGLALAGYLVLMSIVCCGLAFQTRKLPEVFNDAKWLAMTMFTQNIVWFASITIYVANRNNRALVMCTNVVISGYVIWVFNFLPKLLMMIRHPEKNRREVVRRQIFSMTQRIVKKEYLGSHPRVKTYLEEISDNNGNPDWGSTQTNISFITPTALTDAGEKF